MCRAKKIEFRDSLWRKQFVSVSHLLGRSPAGWIASRHDPPATGDYSSQALLGHYRVMHVVSEGGFSTVYEARDLERDDARVALKVLHPRPGDDRWVRDRFAHEIAAFRSIDHPGVIPILDSWVSAAGEPCLAMPFLDAPTLHEVLQEQPLPASRVAELLRRLGDALQAVHERGIVHRDLKPENVILTSHETYEQPVLIDFGMAAIRGPERELADTALLGGSLPYMAPERLAGRYAPATDVYSLGVMVLEMLTGNRLNDLGAMASEDDFLDVLSATLRPVVARAEAVAEQLAPSFQPEPRSRPADVASWAARVAQSLESV